MRLSGGSSSIRRNATVRAAGDGVGIRSGTAAATGDDSRRDGSSEASGLAETV
jgi:hypothetical protein